MNWCLRWNKLNFLAVLFWPAFIIGANILLLRIVCPGFSLWRQLPLLWFCLQNIPAAACQTLPAAVIILIAVLADLGSGSHGNGRRQKWLDILQSNWPYDIQLFLMVTMVDLYDNGVWHSSEREDSRCGRWAARGRFFAHLNPLFNQWPACSLTELTSSRTESLLKDRYLSYSGLDSRSLKSKISSMSPGTTQGFALFACANSSSSSIVCTKFSKPHPSPSSSLQSL